MAFPNQGWVCLILPNGWLQLVSGVAYLVGGIVEPYNPVKTKCTLGRSKAAVSQVTTAGIPKSR